MKLATAANGTADGLLLVVSGDQRQAVPAEDLAPNLQAALEQWQDLEPVLRERAAELEVGRCAAARPLAEWRLLAPLPRAWQWLDGSAFPTHGELMAKAFHQSPIESSSPLMYQGLSHQFHAPTDAIPFLAETDGIDFEGEFGILTTQVGMGTPATEAGKRIALLVQINDWSLRRLASQEMQTGFGWIHAKPACAMAPFAVTPDELGPLWRQCRVEATLEVWRNGARFGAVPATEMVWGFDELIAHACATRELCAGTVIGSGTVSHSRYREFGSCCIAERRAIEMIDSAGSARTAFLGFGERVRMLARGGVGDLPLFGILDQEVVKA